MYSFKASLLLFASSFLLVPVASLAQVPDDVQSQTPTPLVGRSQTELNKAIADERTREIESVRSDIADLSKFEHGNEYLPKEVYKRDYVEKGVVVQTLAGTSKTRGGVEHHM